MDITQPPCRYELAGINGIFTGADKRNKNQRRIPYIYEFIVFCIYNVIILALYILNIILIPSYKYEETHQQTPPERNNLCKPVQWLYRDSICVPGQPDIYRICLVFGGH